MAGLFLNEIPGWMITFLCSFGGAAAGIGYYRAIFKNVQIDLLSLQAWKESMPKMEEILTTTSHAFICRDNLHCIKKDLRETRDAMLRIETILKLKGQ